MGTAIKFRLNFLAVKPLNKILLFPFFIFSLQALMLAGFAAVFVNGWGIGNNMSAQELMLLRKTNLTTLLVWGLWWPAMIAAAIALGRLWCMVCPMELVNRAGEAIGRRSALPRTSAPGWIKNGWLALAAYVILQVLVAGASVHRVPHYTSLTLLAIFSLALASGLVFSEPRSFCGALCPANALLSVYSRLSPLNLDILDSRTCGKCSTRDCVASRNLFKFESGSCPSLIQPFARRQGDGCVLCLQCAKSCPNGNIGLGVINRQATSDPGLALKPPEAAFVMLAAGFVAHELFGEVKSLDAVFHRVPAAINAVFPSIPFGFFEALWFLAIFPSALWLVTAGLARLMGHKTGFKIFVLSAAAGAAPAVAIAHLAKAAAKISDWGGFLPLALTDPAGMRTMSNISAGELAAPRELLSFEIIGWAMLTLTVFLSFLYWRRVKETAGENIPAAKAGFAVAAATFSLILAAWPWK